MELPYFSLDRNNATPDPEPLGRNQRCPLPLKYVGDCASVITTGRNYYIMSLTGGGKSRRMDDRVVLHYENSSQGWPTTALLTKRLLTNRARDFINRCFTKQSRMWKCLITKRMFTNTTQMVKQGAKDFTVCFDCRQGALQPYPKVCKTTQPFIQRFLGNTPLWGEVSGAKIKPLFHLQYAYHV